MSDDTSSKPTSYERHPDAAASRPTIKHAVPSAPPEPSPISDPFIGLDVGDGYTIVSKLAQGGMGALYIAAHRDSPNRRWAIKVLLSEFINQLSPPTQVEIWNRFQVEAKIALRIEHPHVIDVIGWGQLANGATYIKMELLRGSNLRQWAAERHRSYVPVDDVLRVMAQVTSALEQAHQIGVVHRDLKPENIFVCDRPGGEIFVKLLDFGIARVMTPEQVPGGRHTTVPKALGTPGYWSPEQQFNPAAVDARADIYALGVIVYEMLTGQLPSVGSLAPAYTPPQVPQAWYQPLAQALAHDHTMRPATVRAFLDSLIANTPHGAAIAEAACPMLYGHPVANAAAHRSGNFHASAATPPPLGPSTLSQAAGAYGTHASMPKRRRTLAMVSIAAVACTLIVGGTFALSRSSRTSSSPSTTAPASAPTSNTSHPTSTAPSLPHVNGTSETSKAVAPSVPTTTESVDASKNAATSGSASQPASPVGAVTSQGSPVITPVAPPPTPPKLPSKKKRGSTPPTNSEQRLPTGLDGVGG